MNKARKISALITLLSVVFSMAVPVFAETEFSDDFEGYESTSQMFSGNIWGQQTNTATATLELTEENGNHFISLNSGTSSDSILLTKNTIFTAEQTKLSFKIRSNIAPSAANDQCAHILLRVGGSNKRMFDFGYNVIRYNNTALSSFNANKWYNCNMTLVRGVDSAGKGALYVTFTVGDSKPVSLSYTGLGKNFAIQLGLKSIFGRGICMDDLVIRQIESLPASFSLDGGQQVRLNEPLLLSFGGDVDESTLAPSSFSLNGDTAVVETIRKQEDGQYQLTLAAPLDTDTEYTLTLSGVRGPNDNLPKPDSFSFKTRKTGFALAQDNGVLRLENYAAAACQAYVITSKEGEITGFETISAEEGEFREYIPEDEEIIVLGTDFSPYEASVFAADAGVSCEEYTLFFSEEQQMITAAGKTAEGAADVAVIMLNPGCDEPDTASADDFMRSVAYAAVVKADEDGYFSVKIPVTGISGLYSIVASSLTQQWSETINVKSAGDIAYILNVINSRPDNTEIERVFYTYGEILAVDFPEFDSLFDKSFIYDGLRLCVDENGGYTSTGELVRDVRELTVLDMINQADKSEISGIIENYAVQLDAQQLEVYKKWQNTSGDMRADAAYSAAEKDCRTMRQYREALSPELLFTIIAQTTQYSEVKEVLEAYSKLLGLDMSIYNAQGKPSYVAKKMVGKIYTIENIKDEFDKYLQNYITENESVKTPVSSGSGGNGGRGSGVWTAPITISEPLAEEVQNNTQAQPVMFTDISQVKWAAGQITELAGRGIISGFSDGTFRPNEKVTREQFVTMLVSAAGYAIEQGELEFSDTEEGEWYHGYIFTAVRQGIIHGRDDGSFGIGEELTRQDAAVILCSAVGGSEELGDTEFSDSDLIAEYARTAVSVLTGMGVLAGMPEGDFAPLNSCTRAEAAVMIYRITEVIA